VYVVMFCSIVYQIWEPFVCLAIVINILLTCLMVSFNSTVPDLWAISYCCDAIMMLNIIVGFFVQYVDSRGVAYAQREIIAIRYIRGLFFVDVLSTLPYDYVMMTSESTQALLRLNRLIGLIRVIAYLSKFIICQACRGYGYPWIYPWITLAQYYSIKPMQNYSKLQTTY